MLNQESRSFDRIHEFCEISDRISLLADSHALQVIGYHSSDIPLFRQISEEKQIDVLRQLKVFLQTMKSASIAGESLGNAERSLWYALSTLGLVPPSDMFSRIRPDDVIEIYNSKGIQIWRSLNFYKYCSYTLEEMYSLDWSTRYKRGPEKTAECFRKIGDLMTGKTPEVHYAGISDHTIDEVSSSHKLILRATHDWVGRLKDQSGNLAGFFVTSSVKLIGRSFPIRLPKPKLRVVSEQPLLV